MADRRKPEPTQQRPEIEDMPQPLCYMTRWSSGARYSSKCGICGKKIDEGSPISSLSFQFKYRTVRVRAHTECADAIKNNQEYKETNENVSH